MGGYQHYYLSPATYTPKQTLPARASGQVKHRMWNGDHPCLLVAIISWLGCVQDPWRWLRHLPDSPDALTWPHSCLRRKGPPWTGAIVTTSAAAEPEGLDTELGYSLFYFQQLEGMCDFCMLVCFVFPPPFGIQVIKWGGKFIILLYSKNFNIH